MVHELALSTDAIAAADTPAAWRGWMAHLFDGLDSDVYGDPTFQARLRSARLGELVVTHLEADRHRVQRGARQAGTAGYVKIVAPWQGVATVEQHGRQVQVGPGGWAIYDTTCGYEVTNPGRSEHLIIMLPKARLAQGGFALAPLMGRQVGGEQGVGRLALDTMRAAARELAHLSAPAAHATSTMVTDLVRLSLETLAGHTETTQVNERHARIQGFVERHLRDPGLNLDTIAQALGCSKRQLHAAWRGQRRTLAQDIQHRRLQACMHDLADPTLAGLTITDIAFSWGFNASEHFSRVFREHAGMSPSAFRHTARQRPPRAGR